MATPTICLPSRLELKIDLSEEQFWQLCHNNGDLQFEMTARGKLIVMPPTGGTSSDRNADLTFQLKAWNRQISLGKVFDYSGGFKLQNGAKRAPDSSWVKLERWNALTQEEQDRFAPLCPDFVVELMSPSDTLPETRAKMVEYIDNGARLGWLINRTKREIEIYRPQREVEILDNPQTVSGENVLPDFVLDFSDDLVSGR